MPARVLARFGEIYTTAACLSQAASTKPWLCAIPKVRRYWNAHDDNQVERPNSTRFAA